MKNITSKTIGTLTQNQEFDDWWESLPIAIPFFDNLKLKIIFADFEPTIDTAFIKEADDALACFLALSNTDKFSISELVYKNCMDFLHAIEFDEQDQHLWDIEDKNEIWNFVYPTEIYIERRAYQDKDIYVDIHCECDWEDEHGLQLVFRKGMKVTRVSQIDGHITNADAYDLPDEEDYLLHNF